MKRISLLTLILILALGIARAGEGMWIPMLLQYNEKEMQEMGMKITAEDIEKNYDNDYVKGLRWQLIEDSIVKANPELIIKDEEVKNFVLKQIFPGIDYATLEDDMKANLDKIAANYLKDEKQVEHLKNQLADIKMTAFLKGKMNINYTETTATDFMKKLEGERKK